MVSMLTYSVDKNEVSDIKEQMKVLAAYLSSEMWEIFGFSTLPEVEHFFSKQPLMDMACYDVTQKNSLSFLRQIRKKYASALLMLIADRTISPMEYVRPDVLAALLILRPFTKTELKDKLTDLIMEYISAEEEGEKEVYTVSTKEGKTRIPYNQIYYMEARDKKIYLRLRDKEVAFYSTLDELEEELTGVFKRCHRSFLVNSRYIEKILFSQNEIILRHGITIPLSRSYKSGFKEM